MQYTTVHRTGWLSDQNYPHIQLQSYLNISGVQYYQETGLLRFFFLVVCVEVHLPGQWYLQKFFFRCRIHRNLPKQLQING